MNFSNKVAFFDSVGGVVAAMVGAFVLIYIKTGRGYRRKAYNQGERGKNFGMEAYTEKLQVNETEKLQTGKMEKLNGDETEILN